MPITTVLNVNIYSTITLSYGMWTSDYGSMELVTEQGIATKKTLKYCLFKTKSAKNPSMSMKDYTLTVTR